jgi:hypothetical protein
LAIAVPMSRFTPRVSGGLAFDVRRILASQKNEKTKNMHIHKRLLQTLESTKAFEVQTYLAELPEYAVAQSTDGSIGVTWNPDPTERPNGFPHTYSHQQWFILPVPLAQIVLSGATFFDGQ